MIPGGLPEGTKGTYAAIPLVILHDNALPVGEFGTTVRGTDVFINGEMVGRLAALVWTGVPTAPYLIYHPVDGS